MSRVSDDVWRMVRELEGAPGFIEGRSLGGGSR